jgi:hypothetical protein
MRRRLLRGLVAATLASTVGVAGTVEPAHAEDVPCEYVVRCPPPSELPTRAIIKLAQLVVGKVLSGQLSPADLVEVLQEIIGLLTEARNEVLVHMDSLQSVRAVGDAVDLSIRFAGYETIRTKPDDVKKLALDAGHSASLDFVDLLKVTDPAALDEIGHAINVAYNITVTAGKDAALPQQTMNLYQDYWLRANTIIAAKLVPVCGPPSVDNSHAGFVDLYYTCTAADGNTAVGVERYINGNLEGPAVNLDQLRLESAVNSSWLVALEILPSLKNP